VSSGLTCHTLQYSPALPQLHTGQPLGSSPKHSAEQPDWNAGHPFKLASAWDDVIDDDPDDAIEEEADDADDKALPVFVDRIEKLRLA